MRRVLVIGATSAIAEATARRFAEAGDRLYLLARNQERLQAIASDLALRGSGQVDFDELDVNDFGCHADVLDKAVQVMGAFDVVLVAHGSLPDQSACEQDVERMLGELRTNAISTLVLLTHLANRLEQQGFGTLAVIGSVAGDRGRRSNYIYGTAKAAVATFVQGLRGRLCRSGVRVLLIKPGFVDTPMTDGFRKGLLWVKPDRVATAIVRAIDKERDEIYAPSFWWLIMVLIRAIPEAVFKRMNL